MTVTSLCREVITTPSERSIVVGFHSALPPPSAQTLSPQLCTHISSLSPSSPSSASHLPPLPRPSRGSWPFCLESLVRLAGAWGTMDSRRALLPRASQKLGTASEDTDFFFLALAPPVQTKAFAAGKATIVSIQQVLAANTSVFSWKPTFG